MGARGTVIKLPDATPGLVFVDGVQKKFVVNGMWMSSVAPALDQTVHINWTPTGEIATLQVFDPSGSYAGTPTAAAPPRPMVTEVSDAPATSSAPGKRTGPNGKLVLAVAVAAAVVVIVIAVAATSSSPSCCADTTGTPPPAAPPAPRPVAEVAQQQAAPAQPQTDLDRGLAVINSGADLIKKAEEVDNAEKHPASSDLDQAVAQFRNGYGFGKAAVEFLQAVEALDTSQSHPPVRKLHVPDGWYVAKGHKVLSPGVEQLGVLGKEDSNDYAIAVFAVRNDETPLTTLQQFMKGVAGDYEVTEAASEDGPLTALARTKSRQGGSVGVVFTYRQSPWTYITVAGWPQEYAGEGDNDLRAFLAPTFNLAANN